MHVVVITGGQMFTVYDLIRRLEDFRRRLRVWAAVCSSKRKVLASLKVAMRSVSACLCPPERMSLRCKAVLQADPRIFNCSLEEFSLSR